MERSAATASWLGPILSVIVNFDWIWWWAQDGVVWDWIRTVSAALFGALAGGLFTLRGQSKAAKVQAVRDEAARAHALEDQRRSDAAGEVLSLFREFVALQRDIDGAADERGEDKRRPWTDVWEAKVSTKDRRAVLRTQAELIPDSATRESITSIVGWLWMAPEYSREGFGPGMTDYTLPRLARLLVSEAIAVLGAYLRHDEFKTTRSALWDKMRTSDHEYDEWVEEQESARIEWEAERRAELARERKAQSEERRARYLAKKATAMSATGTAEDETGSSPTPESQPDELAH